MNRDGFSVFRQRVWALLCGLLLAACGTLPPQSATTEAEPVPQTALAPLLPALSVQKPPPHAPLDASAYHLIDEGLDALAVRLALLRSAQRSVDIQTYIWAQDTTGRLLMRELLRTADRGVRVRLLLDDNNTSGMDAALRMLDAHPRITVRLFNPFPSRAMRGLDWARDFKRVNRRMHNKLMLVDQTLVLVGGRNWGDVYFRSSEELHFEDVELLVHGPISEQAEASFERYWKSPDAYGLSGLLGEETLARDQLEQDVRQRMALPSAKVWRDELRESPMFGLRRGQLQGWSWAPMELIDDVPLKVQPNTEEEQSALMHRLNAMFGRAQQSLALVSPYFVPGQQGTQALGALAQRGVRVQVLTNSLAATDVAAVHTGYARHRQELIRAGVQLHELRPEPQQVKGPRRPRLVAQRSSLHTKAFIVDREDVFIGSLNLDPRSSRLNTEVGLIVRSPMLAQQLQDKLDAMLAQHTWQLTLDASGDVRWNTPTDASRPTAAQPDPSTDAQPPLLNEPLASPARRFFIWVLSHFDLDWML
jgi:cardiolipin synthase C